MGKTNRHGNPVRKPKKTLSEDVANLSRAARGLAKTLIDSNSNVSPASKVQDHHRRTSQEIDKMFKK
jgi:hypothetical protein